MSFPQQPRFMTTLCPTRQKVVVCELLIRDTISIVTASEGVLDHSAQQSVTKQDDFHCAPTKLLDFPKIPHELMLVFAYGTAIYLMSKYVFLVPQTQPLTDQ